MKKRMLCLLLGLLLLLTGCAGVPGDEEDPSETEAVSESGETESDAPETEPVEVIEYFSLVKGGKAQFIVICEVSDAVDTAEDLRDGLKDKTGTAFTFRRYVRPDDTLKKIYVGYRYNDVMKPETPKLHGTYGVFAKDGDLYVCADTTVDLGRCVAEFLASITKDMIVKDADGNTELTISSEMLFLKEPTPSSVKGLLLGVPVSDYRIVISAQATEAEKYYAQTLMERIRDLTLLEVPVVTDATAAAEREIILGNTTRAGSADFYGSEPEPFTYALKSKGDDLYIGYADTYCLNSAIQKFNKLMTGIHETVDEEGTLMTSGIRTEKDQESDVRIITANILYVGYDAADPEQKLYKSRMELTAGYFNLYDADFIGVQECPAIMRNAMNPYLDEQYEWVTIETSNTNTDYFPILYNAEEWEVVASGADDRTVSQTQRPWGYVWATFVRKSNPSEKYTMANLHYVPASFLDRGVSWAEYRVPLAEEVNAFIKGQLQSNPTVPVFVTGDYNCKPGGDVYEAQIDGIEMDSTYRLTRDNNASDTIDNICVTTALVDVVAHRVNTDENRGIMSDHAYHYADIRLKSASNS
ncbi:MAG: hypothetical protein E7668_04475 [Ruminococcaceae bacterium]|nr:hypothetical protein [Oscillospiraceae bacterium]